MIGYLPIKFQAFKIEKYLKISVIDELYKEIIIMYQNNANNGKGLIAVLTKNDNSIDIYNEDGLDNSDVDFTFLSDKINNINHNIAFTMNKFDLAKDKTNYLDLNIEFKDYYGKKISIKIKNNEDSEFDYLEDTITNKNTFNNLALIMLYNAQFFTKKTDFEILINNKKAKLNDLNKTIDAINKKAIGGYYSFTPEIVFVGAKDDCMMINLDKDLSSEDFYYKFNNGNLVEIAYEESKKGFKAIFAPGIGQKLTKGSVVLSMGESFGKIVGEYYSTLKGDIVNLIVNFKIYNPIFTDKKLAKILDEKSSYRTTIKQLVLSKEIDLEKLEFSYNYKKVK